jgi:hypothetical protein
MTFEENADKAALLLLLEEADREREVLEETFPNLEELVHNLRNQQNLQIDEEGGHLRLKTGIVLDLFQDIPPQVRDRTREKVEKVDSDFFSYDYEATERPIADLTKSSIDPDNIKDFRPEPALPIVWEDRMESSNTRDKRSWQVCPDDAVSQLENGRIVIEDELAPGTILAAVKDPFNMIRIHEGLKFSIKHYTEQDEVKWVTTDQEGRERITQRCLDKLSQPKRRFTKEAVKNILDNFEGRTGREGRNWDQDPYYLFTRNSLRLIGMDAQYTGAPGMKTRSDITTFAPINVAIEVKSPAESKVNKKAVRQAFDSSIPFTSELEGDVYQAAIGAEISGDAIELSEMYEQARDIRIPLITGRTLLFLVLMDVHESLTVEDLRFLFGELYGEVTADDIHEMYERHIEREQSGEVVLEFVDYCL